MAKAATYEIKKKRSGRFFVKKRGGGVISGDEKTKILLDKGLIKTGLKKAPEPEATEEAPAAE